MCQSLLLKLENVLKKRLRHRSFSVNFTKFLRNVLQKLCFVEPLQRFASEIAKFQATPLLFIKESVVSNCLSIKNNKTWYFLIHLPLIFLKIILPRHIFDYHPILEKKTNRGDSGHGIWRSIEKKNPESIKKEVDFLGVLKKKLCGFSIVLRFLVLEFPKGVAQTCWIFRGESFFSKGKVTNI